MATPSQVIIEPYRNFRFLVEIDGFASAGFNKATGLKIATDVIEYREGGENSTVRKLPGQTKFDPVVLERGVTANTDFLTWIQKIHSYGFTPGLYIARKTITIVSIGNEGKRLKEYVLQNCWPSEWEQGEMDARGSDVLMERLTIQHEGIVLTGTPQPDNLISVT